VRLALRVAELACVALACASAAGCALEARPASEWLAVEREREPSGVESTAESKPASELAELDARVSSALAASAAEPVNAELALAAAALCFQAADARLQSATVAALDAWAKAEPHGAAGAASNADSNVQFGASVDTVLRAADRVDDAAKREILSLATEGLAAAERAAGARPNDVAVALARGENLALIAWANGPARSLLAGFGPKLAAASDAAIAADPGFDHAAPLRLQGRFRGEAPRPFGDPKLARAALERAVELAPLAVNRLFLGDVLWRAGDRAGAEREWRAACLAPGDDSTRASLAFVQELARRRVAALERDPGAR
jgi:hypothetical protein